MELIEDLPIGDLSEEMAATIKSEMPEQAPPASSAAEPAAAGREQVPIGGMLQQLYEQQQIFAYHAQQVRYGRHFTLCHSFPHTENDKPLWRRLSTRASTSPG